MKKSDIVISIYFIRSDKKKTEREILKHLSLCLRTTLNLKLKEWDQSVDPAIGTKIITTVGSTKSDLSMEHIIRDIDILFQRLT